MDAKRIELLLKAIRNERAKTEPDVEAIKAFKTELEKLGYSQSRKQRTSSLVLSIYLD